MTMPFERTRAVLQTSAPNSAWNTAHFKPLFLPEKRGFTTLVSQDL